MIWLKQKAVRTPFWFKSLFRLNFEIRDWHLTSLPTILEVESLNWSHWICRRKQVTPLKSVTGMMPAQSAVIAWVQMFFHNVNILIPCAAISVITSVWWKTRKKIITLVGNICYTYGNISCLAHLWENCCYIFGKFNYYTCGKFYYTSGNYYTCGKFCYTCGSYMYYIKILLLHLWVWRLSLLHQRQIITYKRQVQYAQFLFLFSGLFYYVYKKNPNPKKTRRPHTTCLKHNQLKPKPHIICMHYGFQ